MPMRGVTIACSILAGISYFVALSRYMKVYNYIRQSASYKSLGDIELKFSINNAVWSAGSSQKLREDYTVYILSINLGFLFTTIVMFIFYERDYYIIFALLTTVAFYYSVSNLIRLVNIRNLM